MEKLVDPFGNRVNFRQIDWLERSQGLTHSPDEINDLIVAARDAKARKFGSNIVGSDVDTSVKDLLRIDTEDFYRANALPGRLEGNILTGSLTRLPSGVQISSSYLNNGIVEAGPLGPPTLRNVVIIGSPPVVEEPIALRRQRPKIESRLEKVQVRFGGDLIVDPNTREVIADGIIRDVKPTALDILLMLLSEPRYFSRKEIRDSVVRHGSLEHDRIINTHIYQLRLALGRSIDDPRGTFIRRVERRGYIAGDLTVEQLHEAERLAS